MKISEIIHIMKQPVENIMDKFSKNELAPDFASRAIAFAIYRYQNKISKDSDIKDKNNVFGFVDPSTGKTLVFNSIDECILYFIEHKIVDEKFEQIYHNLYKTFNLNRFDREFIREKYGNVVDLPEDKCKPAVDMYTVKTPDGKEINKTTNLEDAKNEKIKVAGSVIYNSRGTIVDGVAKSKESENIVSTLLIAGSKVVANNLNMYYKLHDTRPGRTISGEYYLFDGKEVNGRYALCLKPEFAGKEPNTVIGFVNAKDLKK